MPLQQRPLGRGLSTGTESKGKENATTRLSQLLSRVFIKLGTLWKVQTHITLELMDTNLYIITNAGIISRNAVTFIQTSRRGLIQIFVIGREEPICLTGNEGAAFLELFQPVVKVPQYED